MTSHPSNNLHTLITLSCDHILPPLALTNFPGIRHYKNIAGCGGKDEAMWRNSLGPRLNTNQSMDHFEYRVLQWK